MVARDKLQVIRQLLVEVRSQLEVDAQPCEHCGLSRKLNFDEFKMGQEIGGIVNKINRWIDTPAKTGQEEGS